MARNLGATPDHRTHAPKSDFNRVVFHFGEHPNRLEFESLPESINGKG